MFESRVSAGATEKLPGWEEFHAKTVAWSYDMDMLENAWRNTASWQTKKWSSLIEFQVFAWMINGSNKKNLNQWETYHKCHKMDSGLRQTIGKIDFIHSSHTLLSTILLCGYYSSAFQIGSVPGLRFCLRL